MIKSALDRLWDKADSDFFRRYPARLYHIRHVYNGECNSEFLTLGMHEERRRRVILTKVDAFQQSLPDDKLLKIPFLAFSDETIEDTDEILFPIVRDIMLEALKGQPDILAEMNRRSN
jgi:hypothetical protein